MAHRGRFQLEKWYLDVVADDGEVVIGYAVKLRYGLLRLNCGALLHAAPGQAVHTATQLTGLDLPEERDGVLHWSGPRAARGAGGVRGAWSRQLSGPNLTLLDGPDGAVRWHARQLRSDVRLTLPDGRTIAGLGYAERLELTIAPWRLPIRELRWGRFTAPGAALAWVDWRGSHPLCLVLHGGTTADVTAGAARDVASGAMPGAMPGAAAPVPGATVADDAVSFPDGSRLAFDESLVLRDGTLGSEALRAVPLLRAALPPALLGTRETKWRSRGTLVHPDGRVERGWVIHELVRFPEAMGAT